MTTIPDAAIEAAARVRWQRHGHDFDRDEQPMNGTRQVARDSYLANARAELAAALPHLTPAAPVGAAERGRQLASQREDLIAQGVDPAELLMPLHPGATATPPHDDRAALRDALVDYVAGQLDQDGYGWAAGDGPSMSTVIWHVLSSGLVVPVGEAPGLGLERTREWLRRHPSKALRLLAEQLDQDQADLREAVVEVDRYRRWHAEVRQECADLRAELQLTERLADRLREGRAAAEADRDRIMGFRVPVNGRPGGSISLEEFEQAYVWYGRRYRQSAQSICERGGFGWDELTEQLGHEPKTWRPTPGDRNAYAKQRALAVETGGA